MFAWLLALTTQLPFLHFHPDLPHSHSSCGQPRGHRKSQSPAKMLAEGGRAQDKCVGVISSVLGDISLLAFKDSSSSGSHWSPGDRSFERGEAGWNRGDTSPGSTITRRRPFYVHSSPKTSRDRKERDGREEEEKHRGLDRKWETRRNSE